MPDPTDVSVGLEIARLRKLRGFTQSTIADAVGLTFQQIQKYESGANRISASKLYRISKLLEVPVEGFFKYVGGADTDQPKRYKRDGLELSRYFQEIPDEQRSALLAFTKAVAAPRD